MLKPRILHVDLAMESGRSLTLSAFHASILLRFFFFFFFFFFNFLHMHFNYYLFRYYFTCNIGSLGATASSSFDYVSNVMVNRAVLTETTNGRIANKNVASN
jgi:hypothetical protein